MLSPGALLQCVSPLGYTTYDYDLTNGATTVDEGTFAVALHSGTITRYNFDMLTVLVLGCVTNVLLVNVGVDGIGNVEYWRVIQ